MGLVLTVDTNLALSFDEKIFIEFNECQKKKSEMSLLDTLSLEERPGMIVEGQKYAFHINGEKVTLNLVTEKSCGQNKSRINIEAPKNIRIGRMESKNIPDLNYEYVSMKNQNKKKKEENKLNMEIQIPKEDTLKERYKNELSWFYNL